MTYVWVQLYIGGKESGSPFKIRVEGESDIDDLRNAVYPAKDKSLGHCNAADLLVYNNEKVKLDPRDPVPMDTKEKPLVVEAPEKQPGKF
jgi:hypothetical protein